MSDDKMKLYSQSVEVQVLGTLLLQDAPLLLSQFPYLTPEHFYFRLHCQIFEEIQKVKGGEPSLDKIAGIFPDYDNYIHKLPLAARLDAFKESVLHLVDLAKRRKLEAVAESITATAYDANITANESILRLNGEFENLLKKDFEFDIKDSLRVSREITNSLISDYEITPTGIKILDTAMGGGLYRGKAYAIAARKKTGKTIIASTISNNLNFSGRKHLFIAAEMSPVEIHQRNMARNIGRNSLCFIGNIRRNGSFQQEVYDYKDPGNIYYMKAPGVQFNQLRMALSSAISRYKIEGFILDYFQLVGGKSGKDSLVNHYDEVAQWIATFCRDNNVWALVMAQMNQEDNIRGGEGIRLAFDQVYELKKCDAENAFFMEQMDTRYTPWCEMGAKDNPSLIMEKDGPYFRDRSETGGAVYQPHEKDTVFIDEF